MFSPEFSQKPGGTRPARKLSKIKKMGTRKVKNFQKAGRNKTAKGKERTERAAGEGTSRIGEGKLNLGGEKSPSVTSAKKEGDRVWKVPWETGPGGKRKRV